ncbi:MAG: NAD(P)/FAD-dependent oxidoreductase [Actinobacteria bacterium]|nr:NAD(P)/FAD-dependent oxidoreductase [Actinomycetota bacterium]
MRWKKRKIGNWEDKRLGTERYMKYDVIIAGASFAGLAVASRVKGNILLIDKQDVGLNETSACAAPYSLVKRIAGEEVIFQVFEKAKVHTVLDEIDFDLNNLYCTFDYKKFCESFFKKIQVEFVKAKVKTFNEGKVITDKGEFQSDCIVDATGWRAVLASSLEKNFVDRTKLSFGIETVLDFKTDEMHFYFYNNSKTIKDGYAWVFPVGKMARFGIGSYGRNPSLKKKLAKFLDEFGLEVNSVYGGFFPHEFREPVVGKIFLAGDSAGHCLPLTGEGIRTAIYFGEVCGDIIQEIIDKKLTLEEGLSKYKNVVVSHRRYFDVLERKQSTFSSISDFWVTQLFKYTRLKPVYQYAMNKYESLGFLFGSKKGME